MHPYSCYFIITSWLWKNGVLTLSIFGGGSLPVLFLVLLMPFLRILKEIPYTLFDYKVPSKTLYAIYYYQKFSFVVSCFIMVSICKLKLVFYQFI